jgi:hypothetical protein
MGSRANFLVVYVAEAHATDEWPIQSARFNAGRGAVCIAQTRTLAARAEQAERFSVDFGFTAAGVPTACDDPEAGEPFEQAFAPWPVRFYVLRRDPISSAGARPGEVEGGDKSGGFGLPRLKFSSSPRDSGFIDLAPFADAVRLAAARPLSALFE